MNREYLIDAILVGCAAAWYAFASDIALGYPEMIRLGYQACATCHLAPSGGGATTAYGRMAGEEMASWAPENSGQLLGFYPEPGRVAVGGDMRAIQIDTPTFKRRFLMQNDYELGFQISNEVWVDAAYGRYEGVEKPESRRHYILWRPFEIVHVRVGRFFPAYGLLLPDHTAATRGPIDFEQGHESVNAEFGLHGDIGELFLTAAAASGSSLAVGDDPQYQYRYAEKSAYFGRASLFLGKSLIIGASGRILAAPRINESQGYNYGPFLSWGITRQAYLLAEVDRKFAAGSPHADVSYTEVGYELVRGLNLLVTHEYEGGNRYGVAAQWLPVPHLELLARSKYQDGTWGSQYLLHLNW